MNGYVYDLSIRSQLACVIKTDVAYAYCNIVHAYCNLLPLMKIAIQFEFKFSYTCFPGLKNLFILLLM